MNLKEAFRYQRFLDSLMAQAGITMSRRDNCVTITEHHLLSEVGVGEEDKTVEPESTDYVGSEAMLAFSLDLVNERGKLSAAIDETKSKLNIDIDAAVELNKFRQRLAASIASVLSYKAGKTTGTAIGYRLNEVSGSQECYKYTVECVTAEAFDRDSFAAARRELLKDAEKTSAEIDLAIVTSEVPYDPPFDVNASFDEAVESWQKRQAA